MRLAPREVEKLALHQAGFLAQKRLARGLRLNYTEAVALIATQILEFVRDGDKTVAELMCIGKQLLGRRQVLPAVPHLLDRVQVNGTFMDGTKLITIHDPIACDNGNLELALRGSVFPVPSLDKFVVDVADCVPGKFICRCDEKIILNVGRKIVRLKVVNKADRPIQIGSHYHFIEVNPYLVFDRRKAYGMRLNIRAGTATRFEDALPLILFHLESGCTMPVTKVPIFSQGIPNTSPLSALEVIKLLEVEMTLWMALLIIPSLMK